MSNEALRAKFNRMGLEFEELQGASDGKRKLRDAVRSMPTLGASISDAQLSILVDLVDSGRDALLETFADRVHQAGAVLDKPSAQAVLGLFLLIETMSEFYQLREPFVEMAVKRHAAESDLKPEVLHGDEARDFLAEKDCDCESCDAALDNLARGGGILVFHDNLVGLVPNPDKVN